MKTMILVLSPKESRDLLNGKLSVLVRKRFPKNYIGWVYIYVTKGNKKERLIADLQPDKVYHPLTELLHRGVYSIVDEDLIWNDCKKNILNGKVVARFWCDKVEYIENTYDEFRWGEEDYNTETLNPDKLYEKSCLSFEEMDKYLQGDYGYAINITNLKPFEKPKELNEFNLWQDCGKCWHEEDCDCEKEHCFFCKTLTRAPRNGWCYVEV